MLNKSTFKTRLQACYGVIIAPAMLNTGVPLWRVQAMAAAMMRISSPAPGVEGGDDRDQS